jgi:hypothetical protein
MLLTTLDPCGMCHGAAVQASVGCVLYAGSDPHGGTGSLVFGTPQAQRRRLRVAGPLDNECARRACTGRSSVPDLQHYKPRRAHKDAQVFTDAAARKAGVADLNFAIAMTG